MSCAVVATAAPLWRGQLLSRCAFSRGRIDIWNVHRQPLGRRRACRPGQQGCARCPDDNVAISYRPEAGTRL